MELDHVEAFVAIVRRGGFTRGAAELHLSQPAISRRIGLLEHELGAPLFDRLGAGVALTDAGRAFLPHAEALLAARRDGAEAVAAMRDEQRGAVGLAVVGTLAGSELTARLRAFRAAHPGVDLRIQTALSAEVSALVRRGDATLGLRYGAEPDPALEATALADERLVPVCAADHPLGGRRRIAAAALAGERWVTFPPRGGSEPYAAAVAGALAAAGLGGAEIVPIDSLTAQKRMVEAGFGVALLPLTGIDEELRAGTLRRLPRAAPEATIPVLLVRRRGGFLSGAARALLAALEGLRSDDSDEPWPHRGAAHVHRSSTASR